MAAGGLRSQVKRGEVGLDSGCFFLGGGGGTLASECLSSIHQLLSL